MANIKRQQLRFYYIKMTLLYILITIFSFLIGHLDTQPTDNSAGLYMGISGKEYVVLSRLALPQKLDDGYTGYKDESSENDLAWTP